MTRAPIPIFDGETMAALAYPSGNARALAKLHAHFIAYWRARLSGEGRQVLCGILQSRGGDPLFMAWLIAKIESRALVDEARSAPEPCRRFVGHGAFLLVRREDWQGFGSLIQPDERQTTLSIEVLEAEVCKSLDLLAAVWPAALADVRAFVKALLLLEPRAGRFSSGSDASLPYVIKLTCRPGAWPALLADSLVHEAAHVKLRMAMRSVRFFDESERPAYRHPWRSDMRPLRGVALAAHAFTSVLAFYTRLAQRDVADDNARREALRLHSEVAEVLHTLRNAQGLTPAGRALSRHLDAAFEGEHIRLRSLGSTNSLSHRPAM